MKNNFAGKVRDALLGKGGFRCSCCNVKREWKKRYNRIIRKRLNNSLDKNMGDMVY